VPADRSDHASAAASIGSAQLESLGSVSRATCSRFYGSNARSKHAVVAEQVSEIIPWLPEHVAHRLAELNGGLRSETLSADLSEARLAFDREQLDLALLDSAERVFAQLRDS
jgi:hypothetical protein